MQFPRLLPWRISSFLIVFVAILQRTKTCYFSEYTSKSFVIKVAQPHTLPQDIPTLMIQGVSDYCDPPSESDGLEKYFGKDYKRILMEGIGHFPHRESPVFVAELINEHLKKHHR